MHEKVMQKNYARAYKLVILLTVVLAVLSAVIIPLSLSQQIRDAAALEQTCGDDHHDGEHDGHGGEDARKSQITPLTPAHFIIFGVTGLLWLVLLAWYWLLAEGGLLCTKKYRRQGVILPAGLAAGVLVGNVCLKNLLARPRPCWLDESVFMLIPSPADYSFPSGHTLASAIGATVLTKTNRKFGWAAIPIAVIIAFSRLYLFVHFPSDVLAAAVLGVAIGETAYHIGMHRKTNVPAQQ